MLYARLGDSNAVKQPNKLSFNNAKRFIGTIQPFVMKPSLGKTKQPPRGLQETTRIRHDGPTENLIVILRCVKPIHWVSGNTLKISGKALYFARFGSIIPKDCSTRFQASQSRTNLFLNVANYAFTQV